jgi:hypothetical protein
MPFYPRDPFSVDTTAPYKRTIGIEVEISSGGELVNWLFDRGYAPDSTLHQYHCGCSADEYPIHPTEDTTAGGGEYLIGGSRGVLYGSAPMMETLSIMERGMYECRAEADSSVGMHVHVGVSDMTQTQKITLLRNYLAYQDDFLRLAAGPSRKVRNNGCTIPWLHSRRWVNQTYNDKTFWDAEADEIRAVVSDRGQHLPGRPTLNFHGKGGATVEFRVWNTVRTKWRMMLAAGVSSALVEASAQERHAKPNSNVSFQDFLGDLLTSDLLALVERQLTYSKEVSPTQVDYTNSMCGDCGYSVERCGCY